jgi:hypothetical protein
MPNVNMPDANVLTFNMPNSNLPARQIVDIIKCRPSFGLFFFSNTYPVRYY